jgi:hypothetical protein
MESDSAVTIRNVTVSHVGDGIQIANGRSDSGGVPLAGLRYSIHDVIVDDLNAAKYAGFGTFAQISTGRGIPVVQDATINHVTAVPSNAMLTLGDDIPVNAPMTNFVFTNNMVNAGAYPVLTTCGGTANCAYYNAPRIALDACLQPYTFSHNAVIASSATSLPASTPSEITSRQLPHPSISSTTAAGTIICRAIGPTRMQELTARIWGPM